MSIRRLSITTMLLWLSWAISGAAQTTTITGTIKDLTNNPVTSGKVVFTLKPSIDTTISGAARFAPGPPVTCYIQTNGTLLNAAQTAACTVVMNTSLLPAGTSYRVDICPSNTCESSFNFYALNSSYDISTIVPTPTTGPAQNFVDVYSNQTIAGNKDFTGSTTFGGPVSLAGGVDEPTEFILNPGNFSPGSSNQFTQSVIGTSTAAAIAAASGATCCIADALAGVATVPSSSSIYQSDAVAGYAQNSSTVTNVVGGYFNTLCSVTGFCWGMNSVVGDTVSAPANELYSAEIDLNVHNALSKGAGILLNGNFTAQPSNLPAITILKPTGGGGGTWTVPIFVADGATSTGHGIDLGAQNTGNSQPSMELNLFGRNSGGSQVLTQLYTDAFGNAQLSASNHALLFNGGIIGSGSGSNSDMNGQLTFTSSTTSSSYTFAGTYTVAPICTFSTLGDPGSGVRIWMSTLNTTTLQLTASSSITSLTVDYQCTKRD